MFTKFWIILFRLNSYRVQEHFYAYPTVILPRVLSYSNTPIPAIKCWIFGVMNLNSIVSKDFAANPLTPITKYLVFCNHCCSFNDTQITCFTCTFENSLMSMLLSLLLQGQLASWCNVHTNITQNGHLFTEQDVRHRVHLKGLGRR